MNQRLVRFHPASELFPLMEGEKLNDLAQDIREHGLREPITLHPDGTILDGRNRYLACIRVGVKPRFATWEDDGSPVSFVVSLNLKRRQLTPSQWAMIGLKAKPLLEVEARERQRKANPEGVQTKGVLDNRLSKGRSNELAGKAVGVSRETVRHAQVVVDHGVPELAEKVRAGELNVKTAAIIANLPAEEQRTFLVGTKDDIARRTKQLRAPCKKEEGKAEPKESEQAPAGTRRLPKQDDLVAVQNYLHALEGVCLGLDKLNTSAIIATENAALIRQQLAGVLKSLRKFYRNIGGNGEPKI